MKKILSMLAIVAMLAACNNGGEEKTAISDTTNASENPLSDALSTANTADSTKKVMLDSAGKVIDTSMMMK